MSEEEEVQNWRQERIKEDQEDQEEEEEEELQICQEDGKWSEVVEICVSDMPEDTSILDKEDVIDQEMSNGDS